MHGGIDLKMPLDIMNIHLHSIHSYSPTLTVYQLRRVDGHIFTRGLHIHGVREQLLLFWG